MRACRSQISPLRRQVARLMRSRSLTLPELRIPCTGCGVEEYARHGHLQDAWVVFVAEVFELIPCGRAGLLQGQVAAPQEQSCDELSSRALLHLRSIRVGKVGRCKCRCTRNESVEPNGECPLPMQRLRRKNSALRVLAKKKKKKKKENVAERTNTLKSNLSAEQVNPQLHYRCEVLFGTQTCLCATGVRHRCWLRHFSLVKNFVLFCVRHTKKPTRDKEERRTETDEHFLRRGRDGQRERDREAERERDRVGPRS